MRRRAVIAAAVVLLGAALVLVCRPGQGPGAGKQPHAAPPRPQALPRARPAPPQAPSIRAPARKLPPRTSTLPPPLTPVVDEIVFEKTEACSGEEVLVTVRAHTPGGVDDAYLHARLGGMQGMQFPMIVMRPAVDAPPLQVLVYGRGDTLVRVDLPQITIKDCTEPYRLFVAHRPRANTVDEFDFEAQLGQESPPFAAVAYHWEFGDGTVLDTDSPSATHSYAERAQERRFSSFLVSVEARDAAGKRLRGRKTLMLENRSFVSLTDEGKILILASVTPRYPARADQKFHPRIRLWHDYPGEVVLSGVRILTDHEDDREAASIDLGGMEALGIDTVPLEGVVIELDLDGEGAPPAAVHYILEGSTADGMKAEGVFSVYFRPQEEVALEAIPSKRGVPVFNDEEDRRRKWLEELDARDRKNPPPRSDNPTPGPPAGPAAVP